jgi:hypothetical protein
MVTVGSSSQSTASRWVHSTRRWAGQLFGVEHQRIAAAPHGDRIMVDQRDSAFDEHRGWAPIGRHRRVRINFLSSADAPQRHQ